MEKYDFAAQEKKWQKQWLKERLYEPDLASAAKPFYNLMMFPYPSAEGLHVGNMYAFTGADIYGRMKRMQGYDVFEPIGLDGFGIHSENYALKIGAHPMDQAKKSQENFYRQLGILGNGYAWDERLETYDPAYYRWTQWLFVKLWRAGLAYRKKQSVNWCPSCKTVLADEQVISGECERCNSIVEKRDLEQWFFRITKYAGRLLENLERIDWSERVKIAQRNWIGKSEGALIKFPIHNSQFLIEVFTTRPDTLFGATYMVLSPEHELVEKLKDQISNFKEVQKYREEAAKKSDEERTAEEKEKTGVLLEGIKAINPVNKEEIPVFIADYVLAGYGTGAIMAVPAHDERDFAFAKKFGLPVPVVISDGTIQEPLSEAYVGDGKLVNSGKFNGMPVAEAVPAVTKFAGGELTTQYRLRDWLISRQRYWGAPIPMVHCEACATKGEGEQPDMPGWYAVPEDELPVTLPRVKDFRPQGKGESPLASVKEFYKAKCPRCGAEARRETDVSDTFLDSAWYYLRYPSTRSARSGQAPWDPEITKRWLPVDLYTGGAEHSVLHLLYVRFIALALHNMGLLEFGDSSAPKGEPFPKFRAHGLLIKEGAKMSKSKGNVVNPDEYIKKYGADVLRMYLMFLAPFEQGGDFRDEAVPGIVRFLERVHKFFRAASGEGNDKEAERMLHRTIKKVTEDIENLHYNTAISALMILLNGMEKSAFKKETGNSFLKLLAPFAPHLTEELWQELKGYTIHDTRFESIHRAPWPSYDPKLVQDETVAIVVQVNGKLRGTVTAPAGANQETVEALVREDQKLQSALEGKTIKKVIYVSDRLVNFVI